MTNQIPEEDRKKIKEGVEKFYGSVNEKYYPNSTYNLGAEFGYTLVLQSAEKRVKELEDGLLVILGLCTKFDIDTDSKPFYEKEIKAKAQQLLSK